MYGTLGDEELQVCEKSHVEVDIKSYLSDKTSTVVEPGITCLTSSVWDDTPLTLLPRSSRLSVLETFREPISQHSHELSEKSVKIHTFFREKRDVYCIAFILSPLDVCTNNMSIYRYCIQLHVIMYHPDFYKRYHSPCVADGPRFSLVSESRTNRGHWWSGILLQSCQAPDSTWSPLSGVGVLHTFYEGFLGRELL